MNKAVAVVTILGTLAAFVSLSHAFGQEYALRLACVQNQRQMCDAVNAYQADHAGISPAKLISAWRYYPDAPEHFALCPADQGQVYSYDRKTGVVTCPNPAHRSRQ